MTKTLLEMVEELNRKPVSDRPTIPLAEESDAASVSKETAKDEREVHSVDPRHRENFKRLLSAAVRRPSG